MRIVNREEFLKLPEGVIYQKYEPIIVNTNVCVKVETSNDDWYYASLSENIDYHSSEHFIGIMQDAEESGSGFKADYTTYERDGLYEQDQRFIIYDRDDVRNLLETLRRIEDNYPI
jgi:hypothetical protein